MLRSREFEAHSHLRKSNQTNSQLDRAQQNRTTSQLSQSANHLPHMFKHRNSSPKLFEALRNDGEKERQGSYLRFSGEVDVELERVDNFNPNANDFLNRSQPEPYLLADTQEQNGILQPVRIKNRGSMQRQQPHSQGRPDENSVGRDDA